MRWSLLDEVRHRIHQHKLHMHLILRVNACGKVIYAYEMISESSEHIETFVDVLRFQSNFSGESFLGDRSIFPGGPN